MCILIFMAAVTLCSDFGAQDNNFFHCFHCFLIYLPWVMGPDAFILVFFFFVINKLVTNFLPVIFIDYDVNRYTELTPPPPKKL